MRTFKRGRAQGAGIRRGGRLWLGAVACVVLAAGCLTKDPPEAHFFDQHVQPILKTFCVGNTSPCHAIDQATGTALGNLDLTSFEGIQKRRDVLRTYGSYPHPLLLLKALPEEAVAIPYLGKQYPSEIRHAGGKPIEANSDAYFELKRWLDNGANRDGILPAEEPRTGIGNCNTALPPANRAAPGRHVDARLPDVRRRQVQPFLLQSCAYGTCHSSPQADFYLTCGTSDEQIAFNYGQAAGFVVPERHGGRAERDPAPAAVVRRRAVSATRAACSSSRATMRSGRRSRTGRCRCRMSSPLGPVVKTAGETFFEARVMPKLLAARLRAGGLPQPRRLQRLPAALGRERVVRAAARCAATTRPRCDEFMALDTDRRQAVARGEEEHRGGVGRHRPPRRADPGGCGRRSTPPARSRSIPRPPPAPFCVFQEWHRIERADHASAVSPMASGSTLPLAFVSRPPSGSTLLEFDTFAGGADLKLADATMGANGGDERRQHPQRARAVQRAWPPAPPTSAAPSGATTARRSSSRGGPARRAGSICGCWTSPPAPAGSSRPTTAAWPAR